jgi:hypothetical protein
LGRWHSRPAKLEQPQSCNDRRVRADSCRHKHSDSTGGL